MSSNEPCFQDLYLQAAITFPYTHFGGEMLKALGTEHESVQEYQNSLLSQRASLYVIPAMKRFLHITLVVPDSAFQDMFIFEKTQYLQG